MFESYHEKHRVHLGTPGNVLFGSKRKSVTRFSRPFSEIRENWCRKITNSKHGTIPDLLKTIPGFQTIPGLLNHSWFYKPPQSFQTIPGSRARSTAPYR